MKSRAIFLLSVVFVVFGSVHYSLYALDRQKILCREIAYRHAVPEMPAYFDVAFSYDVPAARIISPFLAGFFRLGNIYQLSLRVFLYLRQKLYREKSLRFQVFFVFLIYFIPVFVYILGFHKPLRSSLIF